MAKYKTGTLSIQDKNGEWVSISGIRELGAINENVVPYPKDEHDWAFEYIFSDKAVIVHCKKCRLRGMFEIDGVNHE